MSAITYIHTHFNRKECTLFFSSQGHSQWCDCGLLKSEHKTRDELEAENDELCGAKYFPKKELDRVSEVSENITSEHVSENGSLAELLKTPTKKGKETKQVLKEASTIAKAVTGLGDSQDNDKEECEQSDQVHPSRKTLWDSTSKNKNVPVLKHIQEFSTNAFGQIEFELDTAKVDWPSPICQIPSWKNNFLPVSVSH